MTQPRSSVSIESARNTCRFITIAALILAVVSLTQFFMSTVSAATPKRRNANTNKVSSIKANPSQTNKPIEADHRIYAAYYSTKAGWQSKLALNNATNQEMTAKVTLYNKKGAAMAIPPIKLAPANSQFFNLTDWLAAKSVDDFSEGNLEIFYHGPGMGIGGQLTVKNDSQSFSFDVPYTDAARFASSQIDSVWWALDKEATVEIFVTNITNISTQVVPIFYIGGNPIEAEPIVLQAHQSEVIDIAQTLNKLKAKQIPAIGGISLRHSNQPGALAVAGVITNKKTGFSSTMRFVDTAMQGSLRLHGAHLLIGKPDEQSGFPLSANFAPRVIVRNTSNQPVEVKARVRYIISSKPFSVEAAPLALTPYEIREVDLNTIRSTIGTQTVTDAGIEIEHNQRPGSVIVAAASVDQSGNHVIDVPVKDPQAKMADVGGSYPFQLDGNNRAVIHLKNIDPLTNSKPRQAVVMLRYDNETYNLPVQLIDAGQTMLIDIKKIRDEQIKDSNGKTLPRDLAKGQVEWHNRGSLGQFIGRMVQYDPVAGTANSFSCGYYCDCDTFISNAITPAQIAGVQGDTFELHATETYQRCDGSLYSCDFTSTVTFNSGNPAIVSVTNATYPLYLASASLGNATGSTNIYTTGWSVPIDCAGGETLVDKSIQVFNCQLTVSLQQQFGINPLETPGAATATMQTLVTVQTNPLCSNIPINLRADRITNSGGHITTGSFHPVSTATAVVGSFSPVSGQTDATGKFQSTYTAPIFGGDLRIQARLLAEASLKVSIAGLQEFSGGANYVLIGFAGTPQHPQGTNHWGTPTANNNLPPIANAYKNAYYNNVPIPEADKLNYNDQSLPYGGKFDVPGVWNTTNTNHGEHRIGINCDTRSINIPANRHESLMQIFRDNGSPNFLDERQTDSPHWHLRFQ